MKKSGGFIPGIRPGRPTVEYLNKILNYIIFIAVHSDLIHIKHYKKNEMDTGKHEHN